nr:hypothetical protein [Tanacetum cinerariifolium]
KVIRCDNRTEFKNREMNQFCEKKGILRQFSVARTPQQNGVAERRNRTLIEAARTMLADSKLPTQMQLILLAMCKIECSGLDWLFDIDALSRIMNYEPIVIGTQSNGFADLKSSHDDGFKPSNDDGKKDEDDGAEADLNNLDTTIQVSHIPTTRIHTDLPFDQVIRDLQSAIQTRKMSNNLEEHGFVIHGLKDPRWIKAMQEELLQFKLQEVWTLVDLPNGKKAIGTKWVFKNKMDERGIMIRNKVRLVAQWYTQEEGIDYDEVFAPVVRIKAIRLASASFKDFVVYQMDVKSDFLYGNIEEEVEKIDKSLFIKMHKGDILMVQVYVDDIFFGSTKKELCIEFEKMMHMKFQMSAMGELTFFLGLQVKQKKDGIFISQDKYVTEISNKFRFTKVKTASTPIETQKPLLKDEDGKEVDVHMYSSMIGSLMYLTYSRPNIMFAVCACARYQVNLKVLHLHAVKRIFRDYAGASIDRKSTIDSCQFLGCRLISWQYDKKIVIIESSVRRYLQLADEEGVDCLPNSTIFEQLTLMGPKTTAWNELSSTVASAIVCLATGQKFNFSKWIFDSMIRNLDSGKNLMKPKRKNTQVPQPSGFTKNVADEAVHKDRDYRLVRAATTASSLEAEQDSGNINKTQSKATPTESSSLGTTSDGGPTIAQTRLENVSKLSNDSLLIRARVESLDNEQSLGKDASKHGRRIDADKDITWSKIMKLITNKEVTLGQSLMEIKTLKPKVKEVVIQEPDESTTTTTTTKPSQQSHDKGKAIIVEEPMKPKKKVQIMLDEEAAKKLQAKEDLEDLYKLVKARYGSTKLVEDLDLLLWGDLKTMFEPHIEDAVWKKQQGYKEMIVRIKSLLDAVGITAAHVYEYCSVGLSAAQELKENILKPIFIHKIDMDQDCADMVAASKVPMLKPENGATLPKTKVVKGVTTEVPITTAEEKARRRLEDAKKLLEAVENRFGGNAATKKTQRNLLKQQYENFMTPSSKMIDDLYNNLKVYEPEVKGMSSSSLSKQNMAFVSSSNNNTCSTNGAVNTAQAINTAHRVSTTSTQVNAAYSTNINNLSDDVICSFFASQPNSPQLVDEDLEQINLHDIEEVDLRWQMAMLSMRARRFLKKTRRKLTVNGNETISFDKSNVECYNCHKRRHFAKECKASRNQDNKYKESSRKSVQVETSISTTLVSCDDLGGYD